MIIIGIDPGATIGICVYDTTAGRALFSAEHSDVKQAAPEVFRLLHECKAEAIGIERARIYGIGGNEVANTIEQVGWLLALFAARLPGSADAIVDCGDNVWTVERRAVVKALTADVGQTVLKDGGVWGALKALHPDADRRPVAGIPGRPEELPRLRAGSKKLWTKGKPAVPAVDAVEAGPLYGVSSHARAALAVAWALGKHLEQ